MTNRPKGISVKSLKLIEREEGPKEDHIWVVFKCKGECKTILTEKHRKAMAKFSAGLTAKPQWAYFCARNTTKYEMADGRGCTTNAYVNFT